MNNFLSLLQHPGVIVSRGILALAAQGMACAWLILMGLELARPGMASLYLDLNLILAITVACWLLGAHELKATPGSP